MAVDLIIRAKGVLCKEDLDLVDLLRRCRLGFGSYSPYFVLEDKHPNNVGLLYNPKRLGRGIYFDGSKKDQGMVKLSFNLPTTPTEIDDVLRVVAEVKVQYRNVELISDDLTLSVEEFVNRKQRFLQYSLASLRGFCETRQYESAILTLVTFPYTLTPDEMVYYSNEGTLEEFEELLHEKQIVDAYYASPKLMRKESTDELVAFYTLAEDCPSIMPIECSCFLSLEQMPVDFGLVRFYIDSEKRMLDGYFDYDNFISVLLECGAEYFDGDHLLLPSFTADELQEIADEILRMPPKNTVDTITETTP
ncbi:MAG: hypothetical protein R3Y63_01605 [Eubacteriales bacterium]